jgi:hypothetical protein
MPELLVLHEFQRRCITALPNLPVECKLAFNKKAFMKPRTMIQENPDRNYLYEAHNSISNIGLILNKIHSFALQKHINITTVSQLTKMN